MGSSRNSRSGRPAKAQATDSRCFCPPDSLPTNDWRLLPSSTMSSSSVTGGPSSKKDSEQAERLLDRQLVGELRLLQLHPEPLPQFSTVLAPAATEHLDVAFVLLDQPLEDFNGRRLPGAVRPEQAKAFTAFDLQVQPSHGDDIGIALDEPAAADRRRRGSHACHCTQVAQGWRPDPRDAGGWCTLPWSCRGLL